MSGFPHVFVGILQKTCKFLEAEDLILYFPDSTLSVISILCLFKVIIHTSTLINVRNTGNIYIIKRVKPPLCQSDFESGLIKRGTISVMKPAQRSVLHDLLQLLLAALFGSSLRKYPLTILVDSLILTLLHVCMIS